MNNTFHQTSELSTLIQNTRTQMKVELTNLMPLNVVKHAVSDKQQTVKFNQKYRQMNEFTYRKCIAIVLYG